MSAVEQVSGYGLRRNGRARAAAGAARTVGDESQ